MLASLTTYHLLRRITIIILMVVFVVAGVIGFSAWSQGSATPLSARLGDWWLKFIVDTPANLKFLGERLVVNWQNFLGLAPAGTSALTTGTSTSPFLTPETVDDWSQLIEQLVEERLRQERLALGLPVSFSNVNPPSGTPGLVVVPSTGNAQSDELIRQRIQASFSDRVVIEFDQSGLSGSVQPLFQNFRGSRYLFLLTPLRDR